MSTAAFEVVFDDGSGPHELGRLSFALGRFAFAPSDRLEPPLASSLNPRGGVWDPALLTDSLPDTWASRVLRSLLQARARRIERRAEPMDEALVLASIPDATRLGALRLRKPGSSFFEAPRRFEPAHIRDLAELNETARRIETRDIVSTFVLEPFAEHTLALGGSRPKASFINEAGRLALAKFPSEVDDRDKGAWEYVLTLLARRAGMAVPAAALIDVGDARGTIFTAERFARTTEGNRLHFLSLRALLGAVDNREQRTYRDVVRLINTLCPDPERQKKELWRRTVFKCLVHDGDDHLRNQGFLLTPRGWELSPAFDLNASISRTRFTLTYGHGHRELTLPTLLTAAGDFEISGERAVAIACEVIRALSDWENLAASVGIGEEEINKMRPAFEGVHTTVIG